MKKQILLAFVSGLMVPLVLAAVFQRYPTQYDVESSGLMPETAPVTDADRASVTVVNRNGNLRQMELGEYLTGVVLSEMPASFDEEALKSQAVVARTYTRKRMEGSRHGEAAVCMDPGCCQGWKAPEDYLAEGGTEKAVEKVRRAVKQTDGLVLTYEGTLIDATYFSCSGGSTEDAVAVWGRDVPYLQAVESPGEEAAPRYSDSVRFEAGDFAGRLGLSSAGDPAAWFGTVTYTDGGGVDTMCIQGQSFRGTELRSKLGLRSTAMEVQVSGGVITVSTRGFGHRVGMSQYGAQAMALEGEDFRGILEHYYLGTELVFSEG